MSTESAYADLEIRISKREADGYSAEMILDREQEYPPALLDPAKLPLPWVPAGDSAADGERLFGWLFGEGQLRDAWKKAQGRRPRRRIRLRIDDDAPELHTIPWELLREPDPADTPGSPKPIGAGGFDLAAENATPFSRYLAGPWVPGWPVFARPLRILCVVANPDNLADYGLQRLDAEAEWSSLETALAGLDAQITRFPIQGAEGALGDADPTAKVCCTLLALDAELRKGKYHVLHIVAHGAYSEKRQGAVLYLADEHNQVEPIKDADLAAMLGRWLEGSDERAEDRLRLVFLASCESATRSLADAFRGLAPRLVAAGVPAVIAMQDGVQVDTARQFATTFYHQLLSHGQVDLAANEARSTLLTAKLEGAQIPVLFMRLHDGQLLGQRGVIISDRREMFWPFLVEKVEHGMCTAFLGPRVTAGLLSSAETVAAKLADTYHYPMSDSDNLARVAQYLAATDPSVLRNEYLRLLKHSLCSYLGIQPTEEQKRRFRDASLAETIAGMDWAELSLHVQEVEVHHLLAELPLPLYVTTNADSFMFEALKHRNRPARQAGPQWEQTDAGTPQYVLTPAPSPENPYVLHLNGYDGDPAQRDHLVLSEDDHMAQFVRLSRDQRTILPMNVLGMLSEHSFMFLGYGIDDWEFRVLLLGLIRPIAQMNNERKIHVGVQLDVKQAADASRAQEYLKRYLGRFNIDIYWGTPQQFAAELCSQWRQYHEAGDGW